MHGNGSNDDKVKSGNGRKSEIVVYPSGQAGAGHKVKATKFGAKLYQNDVWELKWYTRGNTGGEVKMRNLR